MGKWVSRCDTSLFLLCGLCLFSPFLGGPVNLEPLSAHSSGLMLPTLHDTFQIQGCSFAFCRFEFCTMTFLENRFRGLISSDVGLFKFVSIFLHISSFLRSRGGEKFYQLKTIQPGRTKMVPNRSAVISCSWLKFSKWKAKVVFYHNIRLLFVRKTLLNRNRAQCRQNN